MTPSGPLTAAIFATATAAAIRGTWSPCGLSMVSAINPLAERGRGNRYWLTSLWFIMGSVAGGLLLGGAAAVPAFAVGRIGDRPAMTVLGAIACLIAIAADRRTAGFGLPLHPRQVNEYWLERYRRWIYAAGFGFQIGTGFATYIMTAATYLFVVLAVLGGSPQLAVAAGVAFGLVRGSAVLLSARCRDPQSLRTLHQRLDGLASTSLRVVIGIEIASAALLAWSGVGVAGIVATVVVVALLLGWSRVTSRGVPTASESGPTDLETTRQPTSRSRAALRQ